MLKGMKSKSAESSTQRSCRLCLFFRPGGVPAPAVSCFSWEDPDWFESAFGAKAVDGEDK